MKLSRIPRALMVLLLVLLTFPLAAQEDPLTSSARRTRYGILGGGVLAAHRTDFQTLPTVPGCCSGFDGGTGVGWFAGGTVAWPLDPIWSLHLFLGFADNSATMEKEDMIGPVATDEGYMDATVRHTIDSDIRTLLLRPTVGFFLWNRIPVEFFTGIEVGLHLTRAFSQKEELISPVGRTFLGGSVVRNSFSGEIPKNRSLHAGFTTGFRGDLDAGRRFRLHPEISAVLGLVSLIPDPWMINSLRAGLGISFEPPPPPLPPLPELPELSVDLRVLSDSLVLGPKRPAIVINTRTVRSDLHPLLPYLFFAQNNDRLEETGQELLTPGTVEGFSESRLPNSTMAMYRSLLNIIGSRLLATPGSRITVTGCNNGAKEERGNLRLSRRRADAVKQYFVSVWGIAEDRIQTAARNLPQEAPDATTPDGQQEARRVEITTEDISLLRPIQKEETDEKLELPNFSGLPWIRSGAGINQWQWRVSRGVEILNTRQGDGSPPDTISWSPTTKELRSDSTMQFTFSVRDRIGQQAEASVATFVRTDDRAFNTITREGNKRIDRFSLILFEFNSSALRPAHERVLQLVRSVISPSSRVTIIGYTDRIGAPEYNRDLARARCESVRAALFSGQAPPDVTLIPRGSDQLLFDNAIPEGRNFCRTVQIIVETGLE